MSIRERFDQLYNSSLSDKELRDLLESNEEGISSRKALCIALAKKEMGGTTEWVDGDTEYFCSKIHDIYMLALYDHNYESETGKWRHKFVRQGEMFYYSYDGITIEYELGTVIITYDGTRYRISHAFLYGFEEDTWIAGIRECEVVDSVLKQLKRNGHWRIMLKESLF